MQMKVFSITVLIVILFSTVAFAEIVRQQGVGQVSYYGWGGASSSVKQEAIQKAKLSALEKYAATFPTSKLMNFEIIIGTVSEQSYRFIPEFNVVDDETDKDAKRYSVVIDAGINATLIEVELQKVSAVQNVDAFDRSPLAFVFVAREVKSQKSFAARKTERTVEESIVEESEEAYVDGERMGYASEGLKDTTKTTGGSTLQKSDELIYDVTSAGDINSAISEIFSSANYEPVEAEYLEEESGGLISVYNFIEDFGYGDDISGSTRSNMAKGCRHLDIPYFAIGTLDIGAKDTDPVTGATRVYVSVTGKVLSVKGRFPKTVASVGPVQYAGLGPNQAVASRNALKLAGQKAAQDLVAQLRAKDVK